MINGCGMDGLIDDISFGVGFVESWLSLEVDSIGDGPEVVLLHWVGADLLYFGGEAIIVEEGDVREAMLEQVVVEGGVPWGDCGWKYWNGVNVLVNEVLNWGSWHCYDMIIKIINMARILSN